MQRRDFLALGGLGMGSLALPAWLGKAVAAEQLVTTLDVSIKKQLADAGLQAARAAGASYCDVRIGRYLRQFVMTREDKVQNVVNTESTGAGVRVIADGAWGFAATNGLTADSVAEAARRATAIAKANARVQAAPVQLAPAPGFGDPAVVAGVDADLRQQSESVAHEATSLKVRCCGHPTRPTSQPDLSPVPREPRSQPA